ncbi:MAG: hypothetical protein ACQEXO_15225 [Pseudomonadota bacterium]
MSDVLALKTDSHWRSRGSPPSAISTGELPGRWLVAWNRLVRQLPLVSFRQKALLVEAWQQAGREWEPQRLSPVELQRHLLKALHERYLSYQAALGMAQLLRSSGLVGSLSPDRMSAVSLLEQAWRLMCGDMVLDAVPVTHHPALPLAVLCAATAGWRVLLVTPDSDEATALQERLVALVHPEWPVVSIPEGGRREDRRPLYAQRLVCVPLGVLAMDLLHASRESRQAAAGLRGRIARLGSGEAAPAELLSGSHTLVLLQDAAELFAERGLDSVALHASTPFASQRVLAEQALALAKLLQRSNHYDVTADFELPTLTEKGERMLAGLCRSRGGLLANLELSQRAVRAALMVSACWRSGEHYQAGPGGVDILDERLQRLIASPDIVPSIKTLLEVHAGDESQHQALISQARVHALLTGLPRMGGLGRWLPSLARELDWLHHRPVWRFTSQSRATRQLRPLRLASLEETRAWAGQWLDSSAGDDGRLLLAAEEVVTCVTQSEASPGPRVGRSLTLRDTMHSWRYGEPPEHQVTHMAVVLTSDQSIEEWLTVISERWPALDSCSMVIFPSSLAGDGLLANGWRRLMPRRWQSRRLVSRRITAKRRLIVRDQGLKKMLHFAKD